MESISLTKLGCLLMVVLGLSACASMDEGRAWSEAMPPAPGAQTFPPARVNVDPRILQMQARMLDLHKLMHRIENSRDTAERARLWQEQAQLIQENMQLMMPLMMSIMRQGMGMGRGDDPCKDGLGSGDTGAQGGGIILMPDTERDPPAPAPLPEERILEDAPQRNSAVSP